MIYSLTERKCGSYLGEDLYECCFELPNYDTTNNYYQIVPTNADKIIDVTGFIQNDELQKVYINSDVSHTVSGTTIVDATIKTIYTLGFDKDDEYPAEVQIITSDNRFKKNNENNVTGLIKVMYTKVS